MSEWKRGKMIQYTRPPMNPDFKSGSDSDVQRAERRVQNAIANNQQPKFKNCWSAYKDAFSKNQYRKCGYCESWVIGIDHGDIDHFAPKGEVRELIDSGREKEDLSKSTGRNTTISSTGYWWLAYDWNNYVLSCKICNTEWKSALFPVRESPRQIPPAPNVHEIPLLLNPFDDDPITHLEFLEYGQIRGKTDEGRSTVEVCGLDRTSLTTARREKACNVFVFLKEIRELDGKEREKEEPKILKRIYDMGKIENDHAGMVRSIIYDQLELTWEQMEEYLKASGQMD